MPFSAYHFYRAMLRSTERDYATVSCPSVCLWCSSMFLTHVGILLCNKIISQLISLRFVLCLTPPCVIWFNGNALKISLLCVISAFEWSLVYTRKPCCGRETARCHVKFGTYRNLQHTGIIHFSLR